MASPRQASLCLDVRPTMTTMTRTKADENGEDIAWSLAAPGSVGSRFQILHAHARGGIGVVSVAFDAELQREVALKQIKAESADDPDSRARFLLEAEVTGRLEHPGIVPVYGLGFDDQGRPYYAMRFVRGITLEEAITKFHAADAEPRPRPLRNASLELRQLLGRFVNVCHTMAYAHSRGVLHRDLKPANVLLGPYNETLIVDWGLAKVLGRSQAARRPGRRRREGREPSRPASRIIPPLGQSSSTDTVAGAAFGTPAFMSPEQAEGQLDRLGPASDIYSLGAVLYTLALRTAAVRIDLVRGHVAPGAGQERRILAAAAGQRRGGQAAGGHLPEGHGQASRGPLRRRRGPGRRHRALAGRRAGGRLSRAAVGADPAVGPAAPAPGRQRGGAPHHRRRRALRWGSSCWAAPSARPRPSASLP